MDAFFYPCVSISKDDVVFFFEELIDSEHTDFRDIELYQLCRDFWDTASESEMQYLAQKIGDALLEGGSWPDAIEVWGISCRDSILRESGA